MEEIQIASKSIIPNHPRHIQFNFNLILYRNFNFLRPKWRALFHYIAKSTLHGLQLDQDASWITLMKVVRFFYLLLYFPSVWITQKLYRPCQQKCALPYTEFQNRQKMSKMSKNAKNLQMITVLWLSQKYPDLAKIMSWVLELWPCTTMWWFFRL